MTGGATPLFFNLPCRDNIDSLLHQHIASAQFTHATSPPMPPAGHPPSSLAARSSVFRADADMDDVIRAQFCAAAAAAAAAAQSRGQSCVCLIAKRTTSAQLPENSYWVHIHARCRPQTRTSLST